MRVREWESEHRGGGGEGGSVSHGSPPGGFDLCRSLELPSSTFSFNSLSILPSRSLIPTTLYCDIYRQSASTTLAHFDAPNSVRVNPDEPPPPPPPDSVIYFISSWLTNYIWLVSFCIIRKNDARQSLLRPFHRERYVLIRTTRKQHPREAQTNPPVT